MRIRPYTVRPAAFRPYDGRFPQIAEAAMRYLADHEHRFAFEHVGSTAIPGCGGKGTIDLLMTYTGDDLAAAVDHLRSRGFPRWDHPRAHPASRPVHIGDVEYDNTWWPVHIHVIHEGNPECVALRGFRDRMSGDRRLRDAYEAEKVRILADGVTFGPDYAQEKERFIRSILELPQE
jgi:GrpB-like predicted nucleotidyltransferase (UPF0157 family)